MKRVNRLKEKYKQNAKDITKGPENKSKRVNNLKEKYRQNAKDITEKKIRKNPDKPTPTLKPKPPKI